GRGHPDVVERSLVVVKPEEQRADQLTPALLVPAKARDHAVSGPHVLDLDHHALAWGVDARLGLADHPVGPGPLEAMKPLVREGALAGAGREVNGPAGVRERPLEVCAAIRLWSRTQIAVLRQEIEGDEGRRRLRGELRHPRSRRMETHLQR